MSDDYVNGLPFTIDFARMVEKTRKHGSSKSFLESAVDLAIRHSEENVSISARGRKQTVEFDGDALGSPEELKRVLLHLYSDEDDNLSSLGKTIMAAIRQEPEQIIVETYDENGAIRMDMDKSLNPQIKSQKGKKTNRITVYTAKPKRKGIAKIGAYVNPANGFRKTRSLINGISSQEAVNLVNRFRYADRNVTYNGSRQKTGFTLDDVTMQEEIRHSDSRRTIVGIKKQKKHSVVAVVKGGITLAKEQDAPSGWSDSALVKALRSNIRISAVVENNNFDESMSEAGLTTKSYEAAIKQIRTAKNAYFERLAHKTPKDFGYSPNQFADHAGLLLHDLGRSHLGEILIDYLSEGVDTTVKDAHARVGLSSKNLSDGEAALIGSLVNMPSITMGDGRALSLKKAYELLREEEKLFVSNNRSFKHPALKDVKFDPAKTVIKSDSVSLTYTALIDKLDLGQEISLSNKVKAFKLKKKQAKDARKQARKERRQEFYARVGGAGAKVVEKTWKPTAITTGTGAGIYGVIEASPYVASGVAAGATFVADAAVYAGGAMAANPITTLTASGIALGAGAVVRYQRNIKDARKKWKETKYVEKKVAETIEKSPVAQATIRGKNGVKKGLSKITGFGSGLTDKIKAYWSDKAEAAQKRKEELKHSRSMSQTKARMAKHYKKSVGSEKIVELEDIAKKDQRFVRAIIGHIAESEFLHTFSSLKEFDHIYVIDDPKISSFLISRSFTYDETSRSLMNAAINIRSTEFRKLAEQYTEEPTIAVYEALKKVRGRDYSRDLDREFVHRMAQGAVGKVKEAYFAGDETFPQRFAKLSETQQETIVREILYSDREDTPEHEEWLQENYTDLVSQATDQFLFDEKMEEVEEALEDRGYTGGNYWKEKRMNHQFRSLSIVDRINVARRQRKANGTGDTAVHDYVRFEHLDDEDRESIALQSDKVNWNTGKSYVYHQFDRTWELRTSDWRLELLPFVHDKGYEKQFRDFLAKAFWHPDYLSTIELIREVGSPHAKLIEEYL